jgi:hypothetical protein
MLGNLLKATVGLVVDLPLSIAKDVVTMGGALTDEESATVKSCTKICKNVEDAIEPDGADKEK